MALIGRLHLLLVHFPIALVISAAVAETVAAISGNHDWHTTAVWNARVGAAFAVLTAFAGWRLALDSGVEISPILEWHRWLGTVAAVVALAAAFATSGVVRRGPNSAGMFQVALLSAALLVAAVGHLGGVLVWGAGFLRP